MLLRLRGGGWDCELHAWVVSLCAFATPVVCPVWLELVFPHTCFVRQPLWFSRTVLSLSPARPACCTGARAAGRWLLGAASGAVGLSLLPGWPACCAGARAAARRLLGAASPVVALSLSPARLGLVAEVPAWRWLLGAAS